MSPVRHGDLRMTALAQREGMSRRAYFCVLLGWAIIGDARRMPGTAPLFAQTAPAQTVSRQTISGADVYQARCAQCHENAAATRAPSRDALQKMPASRILRSLDFGLMMGVAYVLTREEREAVANYLGTTGASQGPRPAPSVAPSGILRASVGPSVGEAAGNWNGWSPSAANTRYQLPAGSPGIKWRG